MFYPEELLNYEEDLHDVWLAAHNISKETNVAHDLPLMCDQIKCWVLSDSMHGSCRLSLRTSSILINGAARIYKKDLDKLFNDVILMNMRLIRRNRITYTFPSQNESSSEASDASSESPRTPEQVRRAITQSFDTSFDQIKDQRKSTGYDKMTSPPGIDGIDTTNQTHRDAKRYIDPDSSAGTSSSNTEDDEKSTLSSLNMIDIPEDSLTENEVDNDLPCETSINKADRRQSTGKLTSPPETGDIYDKNLTRTSSAHNEGAEKPTSSNVNMMDSHEDGTRENEVDQNLPYGVFMWYKNHASRIPHAMFFGAVNGERNNDI